METYEQFQKRNKGLFKDHVAVIHEVPTRKNDFIIDWRHQDGRGDKAMTFSYINGFLVVTGDYGCCTLSWFNPELTLDRLSNFARNPDYFMSKLQASPHEESNPFGHYGVWDSDLCKKEVEKNCDNYEVTPLSDDWKRHTSEWIDWFSFLRDTGSELFDDNTDLISELYDAGATKSPRYYIIPFAFTQAVINLLENKKVVL